MYFSCYFLKLVFLFLFIYQNFIMVSETNRTVKRYHYECIDSNDITTLDRKLAIREWIIGYNVGGVRVKLKNISFESVRRSTNPPYDPPFLVYFIVIRNGYHNMLTQFRFNDGSENNIPFAFFYDGYDTVKRYNINKEFILCRGDTLYFILKSISDSSIPENDKYYVLVRRRVIISLIINNLLF